MFLMTFSPSRGGLSEDVSYVVFFLIRRYCKMYLMTFFSLIRPLLSDVFMIFVILKALL